MTEQPREPPCVEAQRRRQDAARQAMAGIPRKILIMSGKGGVGKTTVAVNLGFALAADGREVALLDADLHGPNLALMAGVEGERIDRVDGKLPPVRAAERVRLLSVSSFLPGPDTPAIWRGPRKATVIAQILEEGDWEGTEALVVDCPPGTGDEPLAVARLMPGADGVVIVTSPQEVSLLDTRKCVHFARKVGLPVLGVVENLAGYRCPGCGRRADLFRTGGGEKAATEMEVPFLGRVPISEAMVPSGDEGRPLVSSAPGDPASRALLEIARSLSATWGDPTARG
jgi:Mrp family chromosome partitioning ATPase